MRGAANETEKKREEETAEETEGCEEANSSLNASALHRDDRQLKD